MILYIKCVFFILSAGLDDTTAAGLNGFSNLQKIADQYHKKELSGKLERGKRYLKTRYQLHASDPESDISTQNTLFALSDVINLNLKASTITSNSVCFDCWELCSSLDEVREIAISHKASDDILYDIQTSTNHIIQYMKHQARDAQQRKAKAWCFDQLDDITGFWLKDLSKDLASEIQGRSKGVLLQERYEPPCRCLLLCQK